MSPDSTTLQAETVPAKADDLKVLRHYNPYAWLAKVGLVLPSTNTVVEPEFHRLAPPGMTFHSARTPLLGTPSQEGYDKMADGTMQAAALLGTAEVDVVAYACTSGSFMCDRAEINRRMAAAAGAPVLTTSDGVIAALKAIGAKRVAMATPYVDFVNEGEKAWLEQEGFEVVTWRGMSMGATQAERRAINRVPPQAAYRFVRDTDVPEADTIFVSCTALPMIDVIAQLEADCGKPVVTSNTATFWQVMQTLKLRTKIQGYGRLLAGE